MKNNSLIGFIQKIKYFIFIILGCSSTTPATTDIIADNIFVGTWVHPNQDDIITFSGNSFIKQWDGGSIRGSFVYDDKNITFVSDSGKIWETPYQINANSGFVEFLYGGDGWNSYGKFYKIDANQNQKLNGSWEYTSLEVKWARYAFKEGAHFLYTTSGRYANSGHYTFINNNLILKGTGMDQKFKCYFTGNGSSIRLVRISGHDKLLREGVFNKQ